MSSDYVKQKVVADVIKEKKAEMITAEMGASNSLQDVVAKTGTKVEKIDNLAFSAFSVPGLGGERNLIGTVAGLGQGKVSEPISDKRGVYVLAVSSVKEAQPAANYFANKSALNSSLQNRVDYEAFTVLQDKANITDNRAKFY